jgi:hypothetical protein
MIGLAVLAFAALGQVTAIHLLASPPSLGPLLVVKALGALTAIISLGAITVPLAANQNVGEELLSAPVFSPFLLAWALIVFLSKAPSLRLALRKILLGLPLLALLSTADFLRSFFPSAASCFKDLTFM